MCTVRRTKMPAKHQNPSNKHIQSVFDLHHRLVFLALKNSQFRCVCVCVAVFCGDVRCAMDFEQVFGLAIATTLASCWFCYFFFVFCSCVLHSTHSCAASAQSAISFCIFYFTSFFGSTFIFCFVCSFVCCRMANRQEKKEHWTSAHNYFSIVILCAGFWFVIGGRVCSSLHNTHRHTTT